MRTAIILISLMLSACAQGPISTTATENANFRVDKLFTQDNCTVYRFYDAGYYHYWANCPGSVQDQHNCGKACSHVEETPTN